MSMIINDRLRGPSDMGAGAVTTAVPADRQPPEEEEDALDMPPGFRFHPTDQEMIYYLEEKVANEGFTARAIAETDINKSEPWDLPGKAKMGEKEWYFFWQRDRKYPTGSRTNRATEYGYWKATGKDKEIYRKRMQQPVATNNGGYPSMNASGRQLVGMKKTLVFYMGRAPRGEKTNWVMHEYRLMFQEHYPSPSSSSSKKDWVVCRVFHKNTPPPGSAQLTFSTACNASDPSLGEDDSSYFFDGPYSACSDHIPPLLDDYYLPDVVDPAHGAGTATNPPTSRSTSFVHDLLYGDSRSRSALIRGPSAPLLLDPSPLPPYLRDTAAEEAQLARGPTAGVNYPLRWDQSCKMEPAEGTSCYAEIGVQVAAPAMQHMDAATDPAAPASPSSASSEGALAGLNDMWTF